MFPQVGRSSLPASPCGGTTRCDAEPHLVELAEYFRLSIPTERGIGRVPERTRLRGVDKDQLRTGSRGTLNAFERGARRIDSAQQRHTGSAVLVGVIKKFGDDNAGALTVQVAYAMFTAIFPLLLVLITVLGIILADDPSDRTRVLNSAFGDFPIVGQQLAHNLHALKRSSTIGLVIGLLGLVYGSTGVAQAAMFSMEQVWNIPGSRRPSYLTRMTRSALFLCVLAVSLIVSSALAGFGTFGRHNFWLGLVGELLALLCNEAFYIASFRTLTPKQIRTKSLLPGALIGGAAWTVLQAVGGYVVGHDLKGASALYGMFGLVLGLIAWLYLAAEISLYAAELNAVLYHRLWPRAFVAPPLTEADQRSLALTTMGNQRRADQEIVTRFRDQPMEQAEYRARGYKVDDATSGIERSSSDNADTSRT
jgi:YihY family inner membrane protein